MTPSENMIRNAQERERERGGVRVRVRMSRALKAMAEACARAVGDDLTEWVNLACVNFREGKFERVAFEKETLDVTREGSEVVWVNAPSGMKAANIRLAMASAARSVSSILPKPFECGMVQGRDYLVEVEA